MDSIVFVLGLKSQLIRSNQLRELVYHYKRVGKENLSSTPGMSVGDDSDDEELPTTAEVVLVYSNGDGDMVRFGRMYTDLVTVGLPKQENQNIQSMEK